MKHSVLVMGLVVTSMTAFAAENTRQVEPLDFDASQLVTLPAEKAPDTGDMVLLAPAAPLSYLQVYAVGSSNVGWEKLSDPYSFVTTYDHGGAVMLVAVLEIGYGGTQFAKMSGGQLSSSANYLNEAVCAFVNGNAYACSDGQTVIGWMRYWDVSGNQNGSFEHQNTSLNYPGNTMYDRIWIY